MEEPDAWIVVGSGFADALQDLGAESPASQFSTDEYCLIKRTTLEAYLSELILGEYAPIASAEIVDDWITTRDRVRDYLGGLVVV